MKKVNKCETCTPAKKWYRERLFPVSILVAGVLVISFFAEPLNPLAFAFMDYWR